MSNPKIRVLIVDDSAFARKVVREVLDKESSIEVVGIARDGLEALERIAELDPDVVTLDLVMPDLDGIGVLESLGQKSRPRIVVVSVSGSETDLGLRALELGAVDIVAKPTPLPTDRLYELSPELIFKVKAAAVSRDKALHQLSQEPAQPSSLLPRADAKIIAIGTSTGGPQALTELFKNLPAQFPIPIVIALHIPQGYTKALAARLTALGGVRVVEAQSGMKLQPGLAVIAPGGEHLTVMKDGIDFAASVSKDPLGSLYHPSVNLLFDSVAAAAGRNAVAITLTGMGDDGFLGSKKIHEAGGQIVVEAEESCVVYGMPRVIAESGISDLQIPLGQLAGMLSDTFKHSKRQV